MMQTFTVLTIYSKNSYIVTEKQCFLGSLMAPVSFSYKISIYVYNKSKKHFCTHWKSALEEFKILHTTACERCGSVWCSHCGRNILHSKVF